MRAGSRRGGWYWRAYRRKIGRLATCYLGVSTNLTLPCLYEAAHRLMARLENHQSGGKAPKQAYGSQTISSPVPILNTKFTLPHLSMQHISRPRLLALLDQGVQHPLTLISAPAGFGKTTLLTEWAATTTFPVAWLSCEEADNDPARFLSYLQASLANLDAHIGATAWINHMTATSSLEQMMTYLLNDLVRLLQQDTVVILDDYHLLTSSTVHSMLQFLLDHLPAQLHLILGTRVEPSLPLARLRAHNQVSELRTEDLCFVSSEVEAFVHTMKLTLNDEAMHLLEERTEGWIAAIQLLTLALRGRSDTAEFLQQTGGTHRFVREYITEEILGQQPAEMQHFLLSTCLLPRFCGPLCDALLGETGSNDLLTELRTTNLFISALDETGTWYRYHPFFAETLFTHLRMREPERIPELYRRASLWYEEQHQEEEACKYAFLANDHSHAADLLERLMPQLFEQGEFLHMRALLSQLPPALITASPLLSLASIWAQRYNMLPLGNTNHLVEILASRLKEQVQAHTQDHPAFWAELPDVLPLSQAWTAMEQGDTERSITLAHQTPNTFSQNENALSRFITESRRMMLGVLYRLRGDLEGAERLLLEVSPMNGASMDPSQFLSAAPTLVSLYEARGQLRTLGQLYHDISQQFAQRENSSSLYLAIMQARRASLFYEWNQLAEAEAQAQQALELVHRLKLPVFTIPLFISWVQTRIAFALGNVDQARQLLTRAELELAASPPPSSPQFTYSGQRNMEIFSVRFALMQGQLEQAERWEAKHKVYFDDQLPSSLSRYDYLDYMTLARILLTRGRLQRKPAVLKEALILLDQLRTIAVRRNLSGWFREIQVLTALTMQAQGQKRQALLTLGPVLAQAEPEGYVRLFADEAEEMLPLLAQIAPYTSASPDYIQLIQTVIAARPHSSPDLKVPTLRQPLLDPLSPREQEVLQLVALGLSNQQIAQQLVISLHTVKLHVKHLLAKLAVDNRTQAVTHARDLDLL